MSFLHFKLNVIPVLYSSNGEPIEDTDSKRESNVYYEFSSGEVLYYVLYDSIKISISFFYNDNGDNNFSVIPIDPSTRDLYNVTFLNNTQRDNLRLHFLRSGKSVYDFMIQKFNIRIPQSIVPRPAPRPAAAQINPFTSRTQINPGNSTYKFTAALAPIYINYIINSVTVLYNKQNVTSSVTVSNITRASKNFSVDRLVPARRYTINISITEPGKGQRTVYIPTFLAVPITTVVLSRTPVARNHLRGGKRKTRKSKR